MDFRRREGRPFQWLCFTQKSQSRRFDNLSILDTENTISSPRCITVSSWYEQIIFSAGFIAAIWVTDCGRELRDYMMRLMHSYLCSASTWDGWFFTGGRQGNNLIISQLVFTSGTVMHNHGLHWLQYGWLVQCDQRDQREPVEMFLQHSLAELRV